MSDKTEMTGEEYERRSRNNLKMRKGTLGGVINSDALEEVYPDYYEKWKPLLHAAIGEKESYSEEEILRAMYLASSETEWENHPDNPLNED